MTDIGESININIEAQASDEQHDELELEITDILDAQGTSILNGAADYDPRQNAVIEDTQTRIQYEVRNQPVLLFVSIEATSQPATDYYRNSDVRTFIELVDPGTYDIEWDGRGVIDRRLVIEGDYSITISALCPVCGTEVEHSVTFKVSKPLAHCFGGNYVGVPTPSGHAHTGNCTPHANAARQRLLTLQDNSGFDATTYSTETAAASLVMMHEESAVWYWCGHGGPGIISLPTPTAMTALVSYPGLSSSYSGLAAAADFANVEGLPDNALEDVFMVVLVGCKTARPPASGLALPNALVAKGVDIAIGFYETVPINTAKKWTENFFKYLKQGVAISDAVRRAVRDETNPTNQTALNSYRIINGPGTTVASTLHPARYGRASS